MTSAEFAAKYKLLKCVTENGARTYLAQQLDLGRVVMAHYLDDDAGGEARRALGRLEQLPPAERAKVLELVEVDGVPVVVTMFMPGFENLPAWLAKHLGAAPAPEPSPRAAESAGVDVDAPTQIIDVRGLASQAPPAAPAPAPELPKAAEPPSRHASATPALGGFTAAFGAASIAAPSPATSSAPIPSPEPPAPPAPPTAGSFTAIFGASTAPRPQAAPATAAAEPTPAPAETPAPPAS